jgi:hypothetical protein
MSTRVTSTSVVIVSGPLEVDAAALAALARELMSLSEALSDGGIVHESQPAVQNQPTGPATVGLTAAANHVVGECAANLLVFAEAVAAAARAYETTDSTAAHQLTPVIEPPR